MEFSFYPSRKEMLSIVPKGSVGLHLGVLQCRFSDMILSEVSPRKMYILSDFPPFGHATQWEFLPGKTIPIDVPNMAEYYETVLVPKYADNTAVELIKGDILQSFSNVADHSLDWVYIDHTHDTGWKFDVLKMAMRKVKSNGIIMGHDLQDPVVDTDVRHLKYAFGLQEVSSTYKDLFGSFALLNSREKPKIKILQNLQSNKKYPHLSRVINEKYCQRHGYAYVCEYDMPNNPERMIHWEKVPLMLRHLQDCDYLLFLDDDAYFHSHDIPLDELTCRLRAHHLICTSADIADESQRYNPDLSNSGVVLLKNHPKTKEILEFWDNTSNTHPHLRWQWPPEQTALWHVYSTFPEFCRLFRDYHLMNGRWGLYIRHLLGTLEHQRYAEMRSICLRHGWNTEDVK